MDFEKSFYIIEHENKLEIMSHEKLMAMDKNTYQLIQNFSNHADAVTEMLRLVREGQSALHDRIDKFL